MRSRRGHCGNLSPVLSCGDWPCLVHSDTFLSSLMGVLLANVLTGLFIYFGLSHDVEPVMMIIPGCILAPLNLSYFLTAFLNPGIVQQGQGVSQRYCDLCDVYQQGKQLHCQFCDVCVEGFDHHCGYFGICIGRNNLPFFYVHLLAMFGWFLSIAALVITIYQPTPTA